MSNATLRRKAYTCMAALWMSGATLLSGSIGLNAQTTSTVKETQQENFFSMKKAFQQNWEVIQQKRKEIDEAQKKEAALNNKLPLELKKGQGYKTFKRWEWFWSTRVDADGNFPSTEHYYREWEKFQQQRKSSSIVREMEGRTSQKKESTKNIWTNWSELGPFGQPHSEYNTTKGGSGLGRITCIAFGATEDTIFAGTPASGLWRTTNRGQSWWPMSTELPPHGVLAVAVDPRRNGRVYMGTSRMNLLNVSNGGNSRAGLGMYRSNDNGSTWTLINNGFPSNININRLRIHPTNPDTIFAATNQGVFRSVNAGTLWVQMTANINISDIEFHPTNPSIIYAAAYNNSTGTRARVLRSTNSGDSFTQSNSGIPNSFGRMELAVSANKPNWVYVMCSDTNLVGFGALYRSTDTASNWTAAVSPGSLVGLVGTQAWVNFVLAVAPGDANIVSTGGLNVWRSNNGGNTGTWTQCTDWDTDGSNYLHSDQWEIAYPPGSNGSVMYIGNDGGIYRSSNWGNTWTSMVGNMSIMTLYRLGIDPNHADMTVVGAQDNGSSRYWPYVSGTWHHTWEKIKGGDGMESLVSPSNNNDKVYSMVQNGKLYISTDWGASFSEDTPDAQLDGQGNGRGSWVTPMIFDKSYNCVLTGYDRVYAIKDQEPNIPAVGHRQISVTFPNSGSGELATALATDGTTMYAATVDASNTFRLYRANVTTESYTPPMSAAVYSFPKVSAWTILSGVPSTRAVTSIQIHPNDGNVVYVTLGGNGGVFKSVNKGRTWTNITGGLPQVSVNSIVFDKDDSKPNREGLYIGTDFGVYYRDNAMADWDVFDIGNNFGMANSPVMELEIHESQSLIRAATFGRGLYESSLYTPSALTKYYTIAYGRNADSCWIQKVKFWSGDGSTPEVNSGSNNGYLNMTNSTTPSVTLYAGGSHKLELTRGIANNMSTSAPVQWRVWLDLNKDGSFDDAGELVGSLNNTMATSVSSIMLSIPSNMTQVGFTRMRIAMSVNGAADHDSPFTSGEVEDYKVYIQDCINFGGVLSAYPVSANSATILWSGSESSSYELRYRVKNTATWYTNAVISQPYSDYPDIFQGVLSNLTANTYYEIQVRSLCGVANAGVTTTWLPSTPLLIRTIPSSAPYCASYSMPLQGALSDCETYIDLVKITQGQTVLLNHTSGNDFGYQKFGYSGWGLPMAELPVGKSLGLALSGEELCPPDFNGLFRRWKIWIDLDQNNTFDSDELVYDSNNSTSSLNQNGWMTIPASGTTLGITRMRVSMKGIDVNNTAANAAEPCEALDYGEVQDYKITLFNPNVRGSGIVTGYDDALAPDIALQVSPNPASEEIRVEYNCSVSAETVVEVIDMFGRVVASLQQPCSQGRNSIVMPVHTLASGVYTLRVTSMNNIFSQQFTIVQ